MSFLSELLNDERLEATGLESAVRAAPAGAILAVDIGSIYTRAVLLDIVDGQYRFVARGESPTTQFEPWNDVFEGVRRAFDTITEATGRRFFDQKNQLILPERSDFLGVSAFAVTASAGKPIRTVLIGLVPDVSLASGRRAAESTYLSLIDSLSLADNRTPEQQIDALLRAEPDLILIVGGTDGGARDSLRKQMRTVSLAALMMERQLRPTVLYAGNRDLQSEVREFLGDRVGMRILTADNVRPRLDAEQLDGAQKALAGFYHSQKTGSAGGFAEVGNWASDGIIPTAHGFGRMVRILGEVTRADVLGIDLGSSATAVAATIRGGRYLNVLDTLGIGESVGEVLSQVRMDSLSRWLSIDLRDADEVRNYVLNKSIYPHTVPADPRDMEMEYALAREIIRRAVASARITWREARKRGPLPPFDTILLSGSTLARTPHDGWSALIALDALLPVGITRLLLDPYGLAPLLGAVAPQNPTAVVQVLDSGGLVEVGTIVSIAGRARRGEIVVRGSLKHDGAGKAEQFEVPYGSLRVLPLAAGTRAELTLQPRRVEIEPGQGSRSLRRTVIGGTLGVIIDARGRPWRFPRDVGERQSLLREWQKSLTGEAHTA